MNQEDEFGSQETEASQTDRERAENAEKASKSAGSSLIDKIENSRVEQGEYFYEIGAKGEEDRRLIALKAPIAINEADGPRAIVITQDGPFYLDRGSTNDINKKAEEILRKQNKTMEEIQRGENTGDYIAATEDRGTEEPPKQTEGRYLIDNPTDEFINRIKEIQRGENTGDYIAATEDSDAYVYTHGYGSHENQMYFYLKPLDQASPVLNAINESIRITESPSEEIIKAAEAKTSIISDISTGISNLPKRD